MTCNANIGNSVIINRTMHGSFHSNDRFSSYSTETDMNFYHYNVTSGSYRPHNMHFSLRACQLPSEDGQLKQQTQCQVAHTQLLKYTQQRNDIYMDTDLTVFSVSPHLANCLIRKAQT